jgi:hypothetical protein
MQDDHRQLQEVSAAAMHELLCQITAVVGASSLDVIEAFDQIAIVLAQHRFGPLPAGLVDGAWANGDWATIVAAVRPFVPAATGTSGAASGGGGN